MPMELTDLTSHPCWFLVPFEGFLMQIPHVCLDMFDCTNRPSKKVDSKY